MRRRSSARTEAIAASAPWCALTVSTSRLPVVPSVPVPVPVSCVDRVATTLAGRAVAHESTGAAAAVQLPPATEAMVSASSTDVRGTDVLASLGCDGAFSLPRSPFGSSVPGPSVPGLPAGGWAWESRPWSLGRSAGPPLRWVTVPGCCPTTPWLRWPRRRSSRRRRPPLRHSRSGSTRSPPPRRRPAPDGALRPSPSPGQLPGVTVMNTMPELSLNKVSATANDNQPVVVRR